VGAAVDVARRYARQSVDAMRGVSGVEPVLSALGTLGEHLIENIPVRA
jgi:hypothetical protein